MPFDATEVENLLRQMEDGQTQLQARINGRIVRAMRELLGVARGVVHVRSGDLRDSLYIIAPSVAGDFTESSIASRGVPYAEEEADRGEAHDYPALTIEEGAGIIDGLTEDIADLLVAALGAGRA